MTPDAGPRPLAATQGDETAVPASTSVRDGSGAQNGAEPRAELVEAAERTLVDRTHIDPQSWDRRPMTDAEWKAVKRYLSKGGALVTTNTEMIYCVLAAVLRLVTLDDVPHLEAEVREKVAGEIEAAQVSFTDDDEAAAHDRGMTFAASIARGGGR